MRLILNILSILFLTIMGVSVTQAEVDGVQVMNDESRGFLHEDLWECSAHSEHDPSHHRLYRGQADYDRHEAEHSAIIECEYQEHHRCELAGCRRVRY